MHGMAWHTHTRILSPAVVVAPADINVNTKIYIILKLFSSPLLLINMQMWNKTRTNTKFSSEEYICLHMSHAKMPCHNGKCVYLCALRTRTSPVTIFSRLTSPERIRRWW